MRKNIFILLGTFLLLSGILAYCFNAPPAQAAPGGLWGVYNFRKNNHNNWNRDEFKSLEIENIDFESFDPVLSSRTGRLPGSDSAYVKWKGAILVDVDEAGDYNFRVDMNGFHQQQYRFKIDDKNVFKNEYQYSSNSTTQADEGESPVTLTAGWHKIFIRTTVYTGSFNSQFQVYWTPPLGSEEIIPADKLDYEHWANNTITIPDITEPKAKINYVAAGVGTKKAVSNMIDPQIEIAMPVADSSDLLKNYVWMLWFSSCWSAINNTITVRNNHTGEEKTVTGTEPKTKYNLTVYPSKIAKIPASLIDDGGTGKLSFSFKGLGGTSNPTQTNGLGIIVPYKDPAMPEGRISLKIYDRSFYHSVSPTFVFPTEGVDINNIQPVFFLADGMTRSSATTFRPNYLMMLSGNGDVVPEPDDYTLLQNMDGARMIIPESNPINRDNPNTWYPNYGREGDMFDVVSPNYVPNQWVSAANVGTDYEETEDGKISLPPIGEDDTWLAFQYYSSNFDEDGVWGSGESGAIIGGGLFTTANSSENYTLEVDPNGSGSGKVTSSPTGINCPGDCLGTYLSGTVVTLTAIPNTGSIFSGWSGGGSTNGVGKREVTMSADKTVTATFITITTVEGECGTAGDIGASFCSRPAEDLCDEGGGLADPPGVEYDSTSGKWKWTCKGLGGGGDASCEAKKFCGCNWKEVTP